MTSIKQSDLDCVNKRDVLLITIEAQGHLRPFMALGELLYQYSKGTVQCHLVYLNVRDDPLPRAEFPHVEVYAIEASEEARKMDNMIEQFKFTISHGPMMIEPSCEYASKLRPIAVIYETFLEWGHNLGNVLGVRSFAFCTFALHTYYIIGKVGWTPKGPPTEEQRTIEGLGTLSAECLPHTDGSLWQGMLDPGVSRSIIANDSPCQPGFGILREIVERDFLKSTPKFDKGVIHTVGYLNDFLTTTDSGDKEDDIITWLDTKPNDSVVFVVLGSWVELDVCDVAELAEALRLLGHPFLWALRKRITKSKGSNGPPNVGGRDLNSKEEEPERTRQTLKEPDEYGLPEGFIEEVKGQSRIVPWVDQKRVLRHPALKIFVTHCGWNSLTESVALTPKPEAFLPVAGEQALNAEVAEKFWKVGKHLWVEGMPKTLQRHIIVERINQCLTDPVIVNSAMKLYNDHQHHIRTQSELCLERLLAEIQSA